MFYPRRHQGWYLATLALASLVALPLLVIFSGWLHDSNEVWQHLADTLLADLIGNTLLLLLGVGCGVLLLGTGLAWLTSLCDFPGRRLFDWALMLPLAVPAYVLAFVVLGLLDFAGPVQSSLRTWLGSGFRLPPIRSAGGVILVMTLVLYPYVYLLARTAFVTQGSGALEAARSLGHGPWSAFFRVALPMARPALVAGTSLALMETLADFGTVAVFNFDTFTTAIYKAWFGLFNLQAAAQLASLLLLFVAMALLAERHWRGRASFSEGTRRAPPHRLQLKGWRAALASVTAGLVLLLAFVIPMLQLLLWAVQVWESDLDRRYLDLLRHTLILGGLAMLLTLMAALLLALARRQQPDRLTRAAVSVATLGYALPGSVLAVGVMLAVTGFDDLLRYLSRLLGMPLSGQILSGSLLALLLAYLVRFMAVGFGPLDSGLERIRPSLSEAARNLGASQGEILRRIILPLLRPGLFSAALLVLVDVMKEMPATLLLRPFGWDTLAVRIFEMTSEGEWQRAALPAITLVLVGLLPVILLVRRAARSY